MLTFLEQKYCCLALLALLIIGICLYQSHKMDKTSPHHYKEGFADGANEGLPAYSQIYRTGKMLDSIRAAQEIQYPDYASANTSFPVTAATLLEMQRNELGKINKGLQVEFIQSLQDAEISDLKTRLERVIEDGKKKGVLADGNAKGKTIGSDGSFRIRHLQSGSVFSTISRGASTSDIENVEFGIILDKSKGTCIKYVARLASDMKDGHNIELVGCDYDPKMKNQKFKMRKIVSNDTFNRALHPDYTMYAIPEYNTLNAYPYYVITPVEDKTNSMCLTIDDQGVSIEPCVGKHSQRFNMA